MNGLLAELMISFSKHAFSTRFFLIKSFFLITCSSTSVYVSRQITQEMPAAVLLSLRRRAVLGAVHFKITIAGQEQKRLLAGADLNSIQVTSTALSRQVDPSKGPTRDGLQDLKVLNANICVVHASHVQHLPGGLRGRSA